MKNLGARVEKKVNTRLSSSKWQSHSMADEGQLDVPFEYHAPRYYDFDQPSHGKDADPDAWFDTAETAGETPESSCVVSSNGMVSRP